MGNQLKLQIMSAVACANAPYLKKIRGRFLYQTLLELLENKITRVRFFGCTVGHLIKKDNTGINAILNTEVDTGINTGLNPLYKVIHCIDRTSEICSI